MTFPLMSPGRTQTNQQRRWPGSSVLSDGTASEDSMDGYMDTIHCKEALLFGSGTGRPSTATSRAPEGQWAFRTKAVPGEAEVGDPPFLPFCTGEPSSSTL
jgi:hypothetical protein